MRQLKFRVWNGMEMIHDVTVGKFGAFYVNPGDKGNGLDPKDSASLTPFNTKYHDDTPVMVYTGINDKNNLEIYESDRVKILHSGYKHLENEVFEVYYCEDSAQFQVRNNKMYPHNIEEPMSHKHFELVGNIYQS